VDLKESASVVFLHYKFEKCMLRMLVPLPALSLTDVAK
jgi:hypothetical protein